MRAIELKGWRRVAARSTGAVRLFATNRLGLCLWECCTLHQTVIPLFASLLSGRCGTYT